MVNEEKHQREKVVGQYKSRSVSLEEAKKRAREAKNMKNGATPNDVLADIYSNVSDDIPSSIQSKLRKSMKMNF